MQNKFWLVPLGAENLGENEVGGKAFFLGRMIQGDLPVPPGFVLLRPPQSEAEWQEVLAAWQKLGRPKLAIRSSAVGEDSSTLSFAGQNLSFLEVNDTQLRKAIQDCFESVKRKASVAYRKHFMTDSGESSSPKMAVVIQAMVEAEFSGVFFSQDPRGEKPGWLLEVISGFGEELVSGHQTPHQVREGEAEKPPIVDWSCEDTEKVAVLGKRVRELVKFDLDMEWARDKKGQFWILQARPITSLVKTTDIKKEISRELRRLTCNHSSKTIWDCQTFSEWTGTQTKLSFSLWKKAFSTSGSFAKALSRLGYLGTSSHGIHAKSGVLEQLFGHTYVNMSYLSELYFGPMAPLDSTSIQMAARDWLHLPGTAFRMLRVAWKIQTSRTQLMNECREKLKIVQTLRTSDPAKDGGNNPGKYRYVETSELKVKWGRQAHFFSEELLEHSFLLIILAEASLQNLKQGLSKIQSPGEAEASIKRWMGTNLHTLSLEMDQQFQEACRDPAKQNLFLESYGHRGPGELELSRPRWAELGAQAFSKLISADSRKPRPPEDDLSNLSGVYGTLVRQEWVLFQQLLELRELWKNELLRTYTEIRWISLELGARFKLGDDLFWLKLHEIENLFETKPRLSMATALKLIEKRKKQSHAFRQISLPPVFSLAELENLTLGKENNCARVLKGEGLSPGVAYGEIRVVTQPETTDVSLWPENVVLVAEATDPGWTPLFFKAKAIIVEKGGVLSHCAIVAREMGLPVVSGVLRCHLILKDGEHVWVDGSTGTIRKA